MSKALPLYNLLMGCNQQQTDSSAPTPTANRDASTAMTNADNSGVNARDRNGATLTPGDQGSSEADRSLTQQIRKELTSSTNHFSVTAANVKIIPTNGKVTLRGPVNTPAEKAGIEAVAKTVAGPDNVDNQLQVKTNP